LRPKQDPAGDWRSAACGEGHCALGKLPNSSKGRPVSRNARLSRRARRNAIRMRFRIDSCGVLLPRFNGLWCRALPFYCWAARVETGAYNRSPGSVVRRSARVARAMAACRFVVTSCRRRAVCERGIVRRIRRSVTSSRVHVWPSHVSLTSALPPRVRLFEGV
jgi:hypothetical protein